ncbi:MAG: histidinol-phosphate transaminase [Alphaproteobacteria bacterium]
MAIEDILNLVRPEILKLKPYESARFVAEQAGFKGRVWLDANENPFTPYSSNGLSFNPNRYPEPQPEELKNRLAELYETSSDNILITRGSDEAIDLLIRAFCRARIDNTLICPPTFGMYKIYGNVQGIATLEVPLDAENNYQLDVKYILNTCYSNPVKIVFIPAPAAPMGHVMNEEDILTICESLSKRALVIVDEAYIEFSEQNSFTKHLSQYPNIAVMRTLSKAYGMAGLRIGSLIADPKIINVLRAVMAPYALTVPSIETALEALSPEGIKHTQKYIEFLKSEREKMEGELKKLPFITNVFPSVTNFILFQTEHAEALHQYCGEHGIIIRPQMSNLKNALRFSVGTEAENQEVLKVLQEFSV